MQKAAIASGLLQQVQCLLRSPAKAVPHKEHCTLNPACGPLCHEAGMNPGQGVWTKEDQRGAGYESGRTADYTSLGGDRCVG